MTLFKFLFYVKEESMDWGRPDGARWDGPALVKLYCVVSLKFFLFQITFQS